MSGGPVTAPPAALGLHPRQRLTGGHRNTVWLCDGPDGPVVAKSTRRSEDQLRWLAPLHAAARAAGFHVPALRPSASGQLLHQGWTIEPWVSGHIPEPADLQALAPRIRAFHAACPPLPQRPGFCALPEFVTHTRSGDVDLGILPPDLLARLRSAWAAVAGLPAQAIHGDLGAANLILTDQGPCLIDWDEARVDLAFLDLIHCEAQTATAQNAHLALEIASCWQSEPDHARALLVRSCFHSTNGP
ncbi:MAG: aminoglycoside phosphotransferase family protein [Pseudotabrizicola sp.]|uniref:phosphotransferase enzyme family protein n=1 Tax=Pseudotabrizicola sp. TaxID=2939647 RepID=UPI00272363AE|nr:aminoglycoside phosphotransferase family protein [Pseudotabrizicola sp.]MDO9638822.1 aminoglycoside phosphotransferase family protein [Pseudotabrizicola sp.]